MCVSNQAISCQLSVMSIMLVNSSTLGIYLADNRGMTLYYHFNDVALWFTIEPGIFSA
jgi:predicted lipoprotein with Yx(FWY)xxD motif